MSKKILVIGRGFVGQSIFNAISKKKLDISIVGSREINETTDNYDFVIYASGNSSPRKSSIDPAECLNSNCISLLAAIQKFKFAHWVLVSSVSVYENSKWEVLREDDELNITDKSSIYSAHKILNEIYVKKYIQKFCIMRLSYMYGDLSRKNIFYDLKIGSNKIFLDVNSILRPLNINHISDAVLKVVDDSKVGIYNICNTNLISIKEILELKKLDFDFKNERYINESKIYDAKFLKEFSFTEDKKSLLSSIGKYINS
jgi:nucleoside-diphosphate-sugar epimerase